MSTQKLQMILRHGYIIQVRPFNIVVFEKFNIDTQQLIVEEKT
jgi:hypothetical protein